MKLIVSVNSWEMNLFLNKRVVKEFCGNVFREIWSQVSKRSIQNEEILSFPIEGVYTFTQINNK